MPASSKGRELPADTRGEVHEVVHHRGAIGPVGLRDLGEPLTRRLRHRRQVGIVGARAGRRRGDEGEGCETIGVVERQQLGDRPAHRHPDDVGAAHAEGVEQAHRIRG